MNWNDHSKLAGAHALLGASKYSWLNYGKEDIYRAYRASWAQTIGTSLHALACSCIRHRIKINKNDKHMVMLHLLNSGIPMNVIDLDAYFANLMAYVNDGIGFMMDPEVVLFYSENAFGTADAISFRKNELRIHDLKTGITPAHMEQLMVYAALFCLEYKVDPLTLAHTELHIYQGGEVLCDEPTGEEIKDVSSRIIAADNIIRSAKEA